YALLKRENDISYPLAIVGRRGWLYRDIFAQVEREGLNQDIRFLDYVPEEDLPTLLSLAAIFVFPSLYEGFGLPPLEAMACGTPVVASNTSSLPEALGSAAILIDPQDTIAWAQGIHRLMEDERLRQELRERGLAQASRFSWSASAQKLLDVYNLVGK
ncbi:MAG: glycosyltransferase family 4 protein, partial [Chloroflexi bacterium]|nr:glycosyltransferase family 4 protein [Chloroflexota bacterium]